MPPLAAAESEGWRDKSAWPSRLFSAPLFHTFVRKDAPRGAEGREMPEDMSFQQGDSIAFSMDGKFYRLTPKLLDKLPEQIR